MLEFEWDLEKARFNLQKHGVAFSEAATVFGDPLSVTAYDPDHSEDEDRFLLLGSSAQRRYLIVAFCDRGPRVRIISARLMTRTERQHYERQNKRQSE